MVYNGHLNLQTIVSLRIPLYGSGNLAVRWTIGVRYSVSVINHTGCSQLPEYDEVEEREGDDEEEEERRGDGDHDDGRRQLAQGEQEP